MPQTLLFLTARIFSVTVFTRHIIPKALVASISSTFFNLTRFVQCYTPPSRLRRKPGIYRLPSEVTFPILAANIRFSNKGRVLKKLSWTGRRNIACVRDLELTGAGLGQRFFYEMICVLPCNRLVFDDVKLVNGLFPDEVVQHFGRDPHSTLLNCLHVPKLVELCSFFILTSWLKGGPGVCSCSLSQVFSFKLAEISAFLLTF